MICMSMIVTATIVVVTIDVVTITIMRIWSMRSDGSKRSGKITHKVVLSSNTTTLNTMSIMQRDLTKRKHWNVHVSMTKIVISALNRTMRPTCHRMWWFIHIVLIMLWSIFDISRLS